MHIEESHDTDTIYFSSGDHFSLMIESEWLEYLPMNLFFATSNNRTSAVSDPSAMYFPLGDTSMVMSL